MFDSNYEQRKVKRTEESNFILSTCYSIFTHKYETAISHIDLGIDWIVIDNYETMTEAEEGHKNTLEKIKREGVSEWKS